MVWARFDLRSPPSASVAGVGLSLTGVSPPKSAKGGEPPLEPPAGGKDVTTQGVSVRATRNPQKCRTGSRGRTSSRSAGSRRSLGTLLQEPPRTHALGAVPLQPGATVRRGACIAVVPAVRHPLVHIPVHVVQSPRIRRKRSHRRRAVEAIPTGAEPLAVHRSSPGSCQSRRPNCISSSSPHAPRIPTPTRSANGTPPPSAPTATRRTSARRPTTRGSPGARRAPSHCRQVRSPPQPPAATHASHSANVTW